MKRRRLRPGMAAVEAAIIFPLLLTLTFAMIEYGWMFLRQEQVVNTARQAARLASTPDATSAQVTSRIGTLMSGYGMGSSGYTATVSSVSVATGQTVSVTVSVPYANVQITGVNLFPTPSTISGSVSMEKEGP